MRKIAQPLPIPGSTARTAAFRSRFRLYRFGNTCKNRSHGRSGHGGKGRRGYHQGNLREALIGAALDLIAEKGPSGFTFAEAARSAGVSADAPCRHFKDRDALTADVALRGFERFEADLTMAWNDGKPNPMRAFENVCKAYLAFAKAEPAFYSAMFESGLPLETHADLARASGRAFAVLREATEALCAELPREQRPPSMMMSLHF